MKRILLLLFILLAVCSFGQTKVERSGTRMGYLLQLPLDYNPLDSKKYPVIIFLHGSGEKGLGTLADLEKVKNVGIGKQLKYGAVFTFNGQQCIVVCPQTANKNFVVKTKGVAELEEFILYIKATYNDDSTRYYLTGLSMGGQGTWQGSYLPHNYFAAILPVSAFCDVNQVKAITAQRNTPVWALHGSADTKVGPASGYAPVQAMTEAKTNPLPIWTKELNAGHNAAFWDKVFDINQRYYGVYYWLLTNKGAGF